MVLISLIFTCIGSISEEITNLQCMQMYWVIQNDCGRVWQLCTKIYVATV
jgi:hypothetical protein